MGFVAIAHPLPQSIPALSINTHPNGDNVRRVAAIALMFLDKQSIFAVIARSFLPNSQVFAAIIRLAIDNVQPFATTSRPFLTNSQSVATTSRLFLPNSQAFATPSRLFLTTDRRRSIHHPSIIENLQPVARISLPFVFNRGTVATTARPFLQKRSKQL